MKINAAIFIAFILSVVYGSTLAVNTKPSQGIPPPPVNVTELINSLPTNIKTLLTNILGPNVAKVLSSLAPEVLQVLLNVIAFLKELLGSPILLNGLVAIVKGLLTALVKLLFSATDSLLLFVIRVLLSLLTLFKPAGFTFKLSTIVPGLLALKKPTLLSVAISVLQALKIDGSLVLGLVPDGILNTPIKLNALLKLLQPYLKGENISLVGLLEALAEYLGLFYSRVI